MEIVDALETLDLKRMYVEHLRSPFAQRIAEATVDSYRKQGIDNTPESERQSLMKAQNFWVAPDMVSIVEAAQETMPDEDVLLEEPPAPNGFLILGRTFTRRCSDPECAEDHPFSGVYWRPAHRVLPANQYADEQHDDGLLITWLSPVPPEHRAAFGTAVSAVNASIFLPANRPLFTSDSVELGAMSPESAVLCRYIRTMWTLMQQPLADTASIDPPRPFRRRMERAGQVPSPVLVVTLRRKASSSDAGPGAHVEWSHRWVVRGHWRNQWHPRLQTHRAMWIAEHVKGPEDKPLMVKDKVITWRR